MPKVLWQRLLLPIHGGHNEQPPRKKWHFCPVELCDKGAEGTIVPTCIRRFERISPRSPWLPRHTTYSDRELTSLRLFRSTEWAEILFVDKVVADNFVLLVSWSKQILLERIIWKLIIRLRMFLYLKISIEAIILK